MNLHRLTTTIAVLTLAGVSSFALARGPIDQLTERLDLDEQQATTLSVLFDEYREYVANEIEWRDSEGNPNPEAREQVRSAREALDEEILAVLNDEQAEAYSQMRERREQHRGREQRRHGFSRVLGRLDLSEAQEEAVRTLIAERKAERMHDREQFRNDLASILNEEQLAQLAAIRNKRRD